MQRLAIVAQSLLRELIHRCEFATWAEAKAAIFEWIEVFYNPERFHIALGYQSPVDFETNLDKKYPCLMHSHAVHQIEARLVPIDYDLRSCSACLMSASVPVWNHWP